MTIKYIYYIFTEASEFLPENLKDEKFKKVLISFKDEYHMPIDSYILNTMADKNISYTFTYFHNTISSYKIDNITALT